MTAHPSGRIFDISVSQRAFPNDTLWKGDTPSSNDSSPGLSVGSSAVVISPSYTPTKEASFAFLFEARVMDICNWTRYQLFVDCKLSNANTTKGAKRTTCSRSHFRMLPSYPK